VAARGNPAVQRGSLGHVPDPPDGGAALPPRVHTRDEQAPLRRPLEAHVALDQRRLAGAIGALERGDGPGGDREARALRERWLDLPPD
jgi:hypothetical protein